jgi:hypothetical protein
MVEGGLDIFWENKSVPSATRRYRVNFLAYSGSDHGAVPSKRFVGEDALYGYLVGLQDPSMSDERRKSRAQEWLSEVHGKTTLSLPNVILTDQQASEFSRATIAST